MLINVYVFSHSFVVFTFPFCFCFCQFARSEKLPLSHALAATPIGTRIITDVKATLELRKETTGDMETKLNDILTGKLTMDNLDSMHLGFA